MQVRGWLLKVEDRVWSGREGAELEGVKGYHSGPGMSRSLRSGVLSALVLPSLLMSYWKKLWVLGDSPFSPMPFVKVQQRQGQGRVWAWDAGSPTEVSESE